MHLFRARCQTLFIKWANIEGKKSWWAYFGFENKNMSRIGLFNDIKEHFILKRSCRHSS
jgi:hypothetical protein